MGKDRKSNSHRQAAGKWAKYLKIEKKDIKGICQGIGITVAVAILFYKSVFGLLTGIVIIPFWLRLYREELIKNRAIKMSQEFKEYMVLISGGLQAGYALERAMLQGEKELKKLYEIDSILLPYVHVMNQKISMNAQVEKAFEEFAYTIDLDEAKSLAEIISFAKRSGGDYGKHIKNTAAKIEERLSVIQEIDTITTAKRLELKVMCVMPMGILSYIAITSGEFIAPLYGNMLGVLLMSVCLVLYGLIVMVGSKIIDIKV